MKRLTAASAIGALGASAMLVLGFQSGQGAGGVLPNPNICPPAVCGDVSPLIPMQSVEAVHMGLVWKQGSQKPKILYHARFPEYTPNDVADPELIDLAIALGAFTTPGRQFDASLRDVMHGFDPFLGLGMDRDADDSFQRLTYGGFRLHQGLSQSVPTRIVANRTMERQLLFDINHPHALRNRGKFHTAQLDELDFALNRAAFSENGYSRGMYYNTYCNDRVMLADGRVYVFGGHDMQSNNGLYKVNIFDPETETWIPRTEPCTRANWTADPFGQDLFADNPDAPHYVDCDPLDVANTQPPDPSDMRYARWYPSALPLPNEMILIVGGFNQDASVGPDPDRFEKGRQNIPQTDSDFTATRVNIVVPEVYDPKTDTTIALENARMAFPLYPSLEVVQTGPGIDDWAVVAFPGVMDYGDEMVPGGARFGVGGGTPTFTEGAAWALDVLGALNDPDRETPAQNHWTLIDVASEVRNYGFPTASMMEIDADGHTVSHRWYFFSGQDGETGRPTATIECIDFADPVPQWQVAGQLAIPLRAINAVMLPDGKVLLGHGGNRTESCIVDGEPCTFEEREGLIFQMFDPDTGLVDRMARTTVSRGLHGTAVLLPDASVFFAGENREALIRPDDPSFPMMTSYAGMVPAGDPDLGVPNGQLFYPPYLFQRGEGRSARPRIVAAPEQIAHGGHFPVRVAGRADQIASVVLLRNDHNTHSVTTGERFLKLAFEHAGPAAGNLHVKSPNLPAQAVPGIYMLFVVDQRGVPSVGKRVDLRLAGGL